jgi:hypothetical protein
MAPKDVPWQELPPPKYSLPFCQPNAPKPPGIAGGDRIVPDPPDIAALWTDPATRFNAALYAMAHTFYGGESFPYFDTHLGPCSLAAYLGGTPRFEHDSVWYQPSLTSLDNVRLQLDLQSHWWRRQLSLLEYGTQHAQGRFLVSVPDMAENIDILAALRGTTASLLDLALVPEDVRRCVHAINIAHADAFDRMYPLVADATHGNCVSVFDIWAPGRTNKVQCDTAGMISPAMFAELVVPGLIEQCARYDFVLYHLDGSQALQHLDTLLALDCIDAIEWTPEPGAPWGGSPQWYDLYRKILSAGKSVQAVFVKPEEIAPLFNAVGAAGMFVMTRTATETQARRLLDNLQHWYD